MNTLSRLILAAVVVLVAAGLIAPYTFLPSILESAVASKLQDQLDLQEKPKVDLKSNPAFGMLSGEFDSGRIEMADFDIGGGIEADRITMDLEPFDARLIDSISSGEPQTEEPLSGALEVELSERNVLEIARSRIEDFPVRDLNLDNGNVAVSSEVDLLGFIAPVVVDGGLSLSDGAMVFTPESVEALGVPLPGELTDALIGGTDFRYPIQKLPYDAKVTGIEVEEGRMIVSADVQNVEFEDAAG